MEKELNKQKEIIKDLYKTLEDTAKLNPQIYLVPVEVWNQLLKEINYLDEKLKYQIKSFQKIK